MFKTTTLCICAAGIMTASCSPSAGPDAKRGEAPPSPAYAQKQPKVVMEASPAPPFTYWAPEGAIIRNHPHVPGIWLAIVDGQNIASYYGDQCRASEYQRFVGRRVDSVPSPPAGIDLRSSCTLCPVNGDLRPNRMNVLFNEATQIVEQVACY